MSTEQPLDPKLIEETKNQIRSLVGEIAKLSKRDISPEEFYADFLPRVVSALAAVGGAVWAKNEDGRLALQYQVNLQQTNLLEDKEAQPPHGRLLHKVFTGGEGMLAPPHSGSGEEGEAANPTDYLLVLGPLKTDLEVVGVLEIFQRSEAGPNTQKGYLRFLTQMCELAGDFLKSHQLRHFSDRQVLWSQLEDFTHTAHTSLDPREAAYTIANEGRKLIECDRVSVAIYRGKKCTIEAISGQDLFDKRSNTVRLLGKLATAVVKTGEPVWYTGDTRDMAPQVEDAVEEYVDESHSKTVAVLPLIRPEMSAEDETDKRDAPEEPVGALIIEQIEDSRVPRSLVQRVDVVCRHSSTAMANALEHQRLFLMPVWRAIGKAQWVLKARTLPKTLAISGIVLLLILWLALWPADFKLHSKGTVEPQDRQSVWAGHEGKVVDIPVWHGKLVTEGEVLAVIEDNKLDIALAELDGEIQSLVKDKTSKLGRLSSASSRDERAQLDGEIAIIEARLQGAYRKRDLYDIEVDRLNVLSDRNGVITTWKLNERLLGREVMRGQELMEVADTLGPWEVQLHMAEDRMGHVNRAFKDAVENGEKLRVSFQLANTPGKTFWGTVKKIDLSAEVRGEEGNTVMITVEPDHQADLVDFRRPGAGVSAHVHCGRASIGYCWFHDAIAFVRSRVLFRYF